jgi:hypothetical protein
MVSRITVRRDHRPGHSVRANASGCVTAERRNCSGRVNWLPAAVRIVKRNEIESAPGP